MPLKNKRFVIPFEEGRAAFAVQVARRFDPVAVGRTLGFDRPRPTIYVTGGASAMSPEDMAATRNIVEKGLVTFAEEHDVIVIDGGTEVGIPILLGDARRKFRYRFPLIGIAPLEMVNYPGHNEGGEAPLNTGHSHFVLTAGDEFGDESEMITLLTHTLSGRGQYPAVGVLINGGNIAREEVYARTTNESISFPLVVIEGTGRFADLLANALYAGRSEDRQLQEIINTGRVQIVSIDAGADELRLKLAALFKAHRPPASVS